MAAGKNRMVGQPFPLSSTLCMRKRQLNEK
jgi:hypothetical protein